MSTINPSGLSVKETGQESVAREMSVCPDPFKIKSVKMMLYEVEIVNKEGVCETLMTVMNPTCGIEIPSAAIVGRVYRNENSQIERFVENAEFVRLLHRSIEINGAMCPALQKEAAKQVNGIIFVIDSRVKDIFGRVEAEDLVGAFEVRGGQVHPETYRPNSNHKLFSEKGFFVLDPYLECALVNEAQK